MLWDGIMKKYNYKKKKSCKDCNIEIYLYSKYRCKSCENIRRWKIKEYKNKMCKLLKKGKNFPKCVTCGKVLSRYGYKRCKEHHYLWIKKAGLYKGKNNPMYINGKSGNGYPPEFTFKLKSSVFKRDNYICQKCNSIKNRYLTAHHIDYDKINCKEDNLITLCRSCNLKVNANRDYWYAYFTYIKEIK